MSFAKKELKMLEKKKADNPIAETTRPVADPR